MGRSQYGQNECVFFTSVKDWGCLEASLQLQQLALVL
jgi:hypothetical protein